MMRFVTLTLTEGGQVDAYAIGHPSDVVEKFREVCHILLSGTGPWRITEVSAQCSDEAGQDSDMEWNLRAKIKVDPTLRVSH